MTNEGVMVPGVAGAETTDIDLKVLDPHVLVAKTPMVPETKEGDMVILMVLLP